jgi:hypothetical protein
MLEERLNYVSLLFTVNDITKYLSYEEPIKEYTDKTCSKKRIIKFIRQRLNKNVMFYVCILLY